MPNGSGLDVLRSARAADADVPVVIVNHGRTRGDAAARLKVDASATEFLVGLERRLARP